MRVLLVYPRGLCGWYDGIMVLYERVYHSVNTVYDSVESLFIVRAN